MRHANQLRIEAAREAVQRSEQQTESDKRLMNKQQTIRVAKQVPETNVRFAREFDSAFKDGVTRLDAPSNSFANSFSSAS